MKRLRHRQQSRAELRFESLESRRLLASDVLISEIMYHTATNDSSHEFLELHNRGDEAANLTGWKISNGIEFTFPNVTLPSNEYLVVAADVDSFESVYGKEASVIGGWNGRLANRGETITIVDASGDEVDRVRYADQGEWATRELDAPDAGFEGWTWHTPHDGEGRSLELINVSFPNDLGQNWSASGTDLGTPGRANSVNSIDSVPLLTNARHVPAIPHSTEPVTIYVDIANAETPLSASLHYRNDSTEYSSLTMSPVESPDTVPGTETYAATIQASPNGTVMEFFVEATDASGDSRFIPNVKHHPNRTANYLYQVIDEAPDSDRWNPADQPFTYLIMREPERAMLEDIGDGPLVQAESNAAMNATMIRVDGNGTDIRYNVSVRNRGGSSRVGPPNNYRVNIPHDRPWNESVSVNLNSRFVHAQIIGSAIFRLAGLPAAFAEPIQVRVNGNDLAESDGPLMFGTYAQLENITGSFPDRHFPDDRRGNLYRAVAVGTESADLSYRGPDADAYENVYSKRTNEELDDWSDLIQLTRTLSESPDSTFVHEVSQILDIDQWLRYIALDSLIGNRETGLALGTGDNYWLYRGESDPRFKIIPHDLDTIMGRARVGEPNRSIFTYTSVPGLRRLLTHPETVPRYYQAFIDLIDDVYNPATLNPVFDQILGGFVPKDEVDEMKQFVVDRIDGVLAQLPREFTITSDLPITNGIHRTTLPVAELVGTADAIRTQRVEVNGRAVDWSPFTREWSLLTTNSGETRSLVDFGANWAYLDDGSNQAGTWRQVDLDDTAWASGPAPLGYGNGDEATTVSFGANPNNKHITTYFRHAFDLAEPNTIRDLTLRLQRDDGAIAYLNGVEIARSNLPDGAIDFQSVASSWIGGGLEQRIESYSIDPNLLRPGKNVLAVEVHQRSAIDDDLRLNLALEATVGDIEGGAKLLPGINRINVATFDGESSVEPFAGNFIDVWFDGAVGKDAGQCATYLQHGELVHNHLLAGTLVRDTVLAPCGPAYRIQGDVVVPSGITLTVMPGTTLFFEDNAGIHVNGGRLIANGTQFEPIRMTRLPTSNGSWQGLQFKDAMTDNQLSHAILEHAATADGMIGLESSQITIDSVTFEDTDRFRIRTIDSSLIVRNSTFADIFPDDQPPTTDNRSEHIWGSGIAEGGRFLIHDNYFGTTKGHNDAIDFDGASLPGPIPIIENNYFAGSGDDGVDLETDALVVGNTFANIVKDEFNSSTGDANAISAGAGRNYFVARNVFVNVDHAVQVKDDAFLTFENNTVSQSHLPSIYFDLDDRNPGKGAIITDSIFDQTPQTLGSPEQADSVQIHNSIVGPDAIDFGTGNFSQAPRFLNDTNFALRNSSPARNSGTLGIDRGAAIDGALVIAGLPEHVTADRNVSLRFFAPGINAYRYRLNGGNWSEPLALDETLHLFDLPDGDHRIEAIGRDYAGRWQHDNLTTSETWTVAPASGGLRINEILAKNETAFAENGQFPDAIELFNTSDRGIDVSGMRITDNLDEPQRFVFPPGTQIEPKSYLVLTNQGDNLNLGFGFDVSGETVYLLDAEDSIVDSVGFGVQIPDYSISRIGRDGDWKLSQPTLGLPNKSQTTGDVDSLRINEWFASSIVRFNDDFIELHNPDSLPVDLSGIFLTDHPVARPQQHQLPALSFIEADGFAVFQADGNVDRGPDHLPFRLDASGEMIAIRSANDELIDQVLYFEQSDDWSTGRTPDGAPTIAAQKLATPGARNFFVATTSTTIIDWDDDWSYLHGVSEMASDWATPQFDDGSWNDGMGVFAVGATELPLEIGTDLIEPKLSSYFRSTVDIAPQLLSSQTDTSFSLFVLIDDGAAVYINGIEALRLGLPDGLLSPTTRSNRGISTAAVEGPFSIPASMFQPGANTIAVELHQISPASSDAAFGLRLNATSSTVDLATKQATALLDGLRVTEVMYHPIDDDSEFIELTNVGDQSIDLNGARLRGGINLDFGDVSIAPAQRVVVVRNRARFEQTYGNDIAVVGEYSGALGNRTDRIRLLLPAAFDGAISDFTYHDDWFPETDGDGRSLVVRDEQGPTSQLMDRFGWMASISNGGSPGSAGLAASADFNHDRTVDVRDVDLLCSAVRDRPRDPRFDLTGDGQVEHADLQFMLTTVLQSKTGDVTLDGVFNSQDLVEIFRSAQYEDGIAGNSTWSTGDWNCDGEFDSSDLVVAFQTGGYSATSRIRGWEFAAAMDRSDEDSD